MTKALSSLSDRELKDRLAGAAKDVQYSYRDYDAELLNRKRNRLMMAAILVNAGLVAVDVIIRLAQT